MLTSIEVTIDKTGHLHCVESGQTIKPGRALLTWLKPDTAHDRLDGRDCTGARMAQPRGGRSRAHLQPGK